MNSNLLRSNYKKITNEWNLQSLTIINLFSFNKKIVYLMFLFYQFTWLKELGKDEASKTEIIACFLERNIHLDVVIVSRRLGEQSIKLIRYLFKNNIYLSIYNSFANKVLKEDSPIIIDNELIYVFNNMLTAYGIERS